MNKKLFGTLLLGSLLMGGTFVSCKDYDDDIENLQEQINNLATKSDVETKLSQLQSALTAAQQKAEEALAAAKAADNSAEVKAISEKLDKIADAQAAVNDALEATKNEISEQLAEFDEATKQMIAEAQKKAEETVGKVADYVTGVKLLDVMPVTNLQFESSQISKTKEFGKDDTYAKDKKQSANSTYAYKKGDYVKSPTSLVLRVDPANAQLTADDIKIVDSKGNDLSDVVEIDNVFPYDQLLTTRGGNGLWQVNLKAADGIDNAKLATATFVENIAEQKLYAIAVNNTMSTAEERFVMTDYSITFHKTDGITSYVGVNSLDGVKISTSQNEGKFDASNDLIVNGYQSWAYNPIFAANGETITIEFPKGSKADRFYVVRADDQAYNISGNNIENAWKSYSYEGLGEIKSITDGEKLQFKVTIPEGLKVGDAICFRLYAVNRDGSYVLNLTDDYGNANEKHGMEFWVHVGKNQNNASSVVANITAQSAAEFSTGWVAYTGTLVDSNVKVYNETSATLKVNDNENHTVSVEYAKTLNANGTKKDAPTKNSEIKYIKLTFSGDFKTWTDGATAKGQIVTKNGGVKENVIDVALTKVLPTAEIAKKNLNYSWKAGQLIGGVYTLYAYPAADAWKTANAAAGVKDMTQVLNGLTNLDAHAYIAVANATLKQKPWSNPAEFYWTGTVYATQANGWTLSIDAANKSTDNLKLIDNATKHKSVIGYNFGQISSEKVDGNYVDHVIDVEEFETVFACPLDVTVQTFAWKKYEAAATQTLAAVSKDLNVITYNTAWSSTAQNGSALKLADYLIATNTFDNVVFGGAFSTVSVKYVQVDAKLVSNETGNEDYFTVSYTDGGDFTFTPQSGTTNPAADVPSTLKIALTDCFGHKNEYSLPFTVKRAQ